MLHAHTQTIYRRGMLLNEKQKLAFDNLTEAIEKGGRWDRFLMGSGGTGKTYVLAEVIRHFEDKDVEFICLAPSHTARIQLQESMIRAGLPDHYARDIVMTIQKFLRIRPDLRELPSEEDLFRLTHGGPYLDEAAFNLLRDPRYVVVIDEISMVSLKMLEIIFNEPMRQCGVIMCGDFKQIPPVKSISTYDLYNEYEKEYPQNVLRLVKNERAKKPELHEFAINVYNDRELIVNSTGPSVYVYHDYAEWEEQYRRAVIAKKDPLAICYTNEEVCRLNKLARGELGMGELLEINDKVRCEMGSASVYDENARQDVAILNNGEYTQIEFVGEQHEITVPFLKVGAMVQEVMLPHPYLEGYVPFYTAPRSAFYNDKSDLHRYMHGIHRASELTVEYVSKYYDYRNSKYFVDSLPKLVGPYRHVVKAVLQNPKYDFARLLANYRGNKGKAVKLIRARVFYAERAQFLCLSHIHASTAHRAQGQSREVVFVNSMELRTKELLYVALSRAMEELHVFVKAGAGKTGMEGLLDTL